MASAIGPLLERTLARGEAVTQMAAGKRYVGIEPEYDMFTMSAEPYAEIGPRDDIAILARLPRRRPQSREPWSQYRKRVEVELRAAAKELSLDDDARPLIAANALQIRADPEQVRDLAERDTPIVRLELDPLLPLTTMDAAVRDIELQAYRDTHPNGDGSGVSVAVLDSGVDPDHPALAVADSRSVASEPIEVHGEHGTHCAGSIASKDAVFGGVAPGVRLIDVKVLNANGDGKIGDVSAGIDAALDMGAEVLSMSLGSNHLPVDFEGGHGWSCPDGRCELCLAVDSASTVEGVVVVVSAGNNHLEAGALRQQGRGDELDTELGCPGQAREALTVGAITKTEWTPGIFSSHGPSAYAVAKPDISAPGVNITSTIPVPRDGSGVPLPNPARALLFKSMSGTSMATPIVAGLAALVVQEYKAKQVHPTPAEIRSKLLSGAAQLNPVDPNVTGAGRARAV
jgi:serine protease AprX